MAHLYYDLKDMTKLHENSTSDILFYCRSLKLIFIGVSPLLILLVVLFYIK